MAKLKTGRHTSAIKVTRQALKRRWANQSAKEEAKGLTKDLLQAVSKKDAAAAKALLVKVMSAWTRVGRRNIVHHATASRKIARLSRAVHRITVSSN